MRGHECPFPKFRVVISGLSFATTVDDGTAIEMEFRRLDAFQPRKRLDGFFITVHKPSCHAFRKCVKSVPSDESMGEYWTENIQLSVSFPERHHVRNSKSRNEHEGSSNVASLSFESSSVVCHFATSVDDGPAIEMEFR
ncbi:hypothetical protein CEXT_95021 [Caerostris extrusa]|uniref:Uncharacterized protein n=1 Tax=Caerostris extrusa TaxID=172846 RepID=A0AAV4PC27_CAEEX|nr:hypothetical protein CEXT_95021 [Caerostris extrusa]